MDNIFLQAFDFQSDWVEVWNLLLHADNFQQLAIMYLPIGFPIF